MIHKLSTTRMVSCSKCNKQMSISYLEILHYMFSKVMKVIQVSLEFSMNRVMEMFCISRFSNKALYSLGQQRMG
jgi:hypothetical protein